MLKEIDFGYASGETEAARNPDRLKSSFFRTSLLYPIENGQSTIVLGQKGSGKTTIAEYLRLKGQEAGIRRVDVSQYAEYPYQHFEHEGATAHDSRYQNSWRLLMLLKLVALVVRNVDKVTSDKNVLHGLATSLTQQGLLETSETGHWLRNLVSRNIKLSVPGIFDLSLDAGTNGSALPLFAIDKVERVLSEIKSRSWHFLVIDDLDAVLSSGQFSSKQYSLIGLFNAAADLNATFRRESAPIRVIVLCRLDLFQGLPDPNKNKLKQNDAQVIDWYHDPRRPESSDLIGLINRRASASLGREVDVIREFLPPVIEGRNTYEFFLEQTRFTPRDFLRLMHHVASFSGDSSPDRNSILAGLRTYSIDYFAAEVRDELAGYVSADDVNRLMEALGSLRKKEFVLADFSRRLAELGATVEPRRAAAILYDAGAIGSVTRMRDEPRYSFKYRNLNMGPNFESTFVIHQGLWKTFNIA